MSVLVGKKAPEFTAAAVLGDGSIVDGYNFSEATKGKYVAVVFYPLDFTFVCPTELIALDHRLDELKSRALRFWQFPSIPSSPTPHGVTHRLKGGDRTGPLHDDCGRQSRHHPGV